MKDIDIAIFVLLTIFTALLWHLMVEDMERERRKRENDLEERLVQEHKNNNNLHINIPTSP
eukprot:snap_masked-scaffold_25-processed-gene-1.22-mRNA-1 protein AED:1.00 eAED:1.00 QI:0/0/0/0/1/1/2/0/60